MVDFYAVAAKPDDMARDLNLIAAGRRRLEPIWLEI